MDNKVTASAGSTTNNKTGGWRTFIPKIGYDKCIGCGNCSRVCPESCIDMKQAKPKQKPIIDYDFCKGCGVCAEECPVKTIKMEKEIK